MTASGSRFYEELEGDIEAPDSNTRALQSRLRQVEEARNFFMRTSKYAAALAVRDRPLNLRQPINRIPMEMLCEIFRQTGECGRDINTALNISQTCFYWRQIALGDPAMWSYLDLSSPYAELFLSRTRGHLLTIKDEDGLTRWGADVCRQNLPRLQALDLNLDGVLPWLTEEPAPQLVKLSLQMAPQQDGRMRPLFNGMTPRLRNLRLVGLRMPWAPGAYANLTTLCISTYREFDEDADILSLFWDSPRLKNVVISISPDQPKASVYHQLIKKDALQRRDRLGLRDLKSMILHMPYWYAHYILSSIDVPGVIDLDVTVQDCQPIGVAADSIPTHVFDPACLPFELSKTFNTVSVFHSAYDGLLITGKRADETEYLLRFAYGGWDEDGAVTLSMVNALKKFEMPRLESLEFAELPLDGTAADTILSATSHLQSTVSLGLSRVSPEFVAALASRKPSTTFPQLRHLHMSRLHFSVADALNLCRDLNALDKVICEGCTVLIHTAETLWQALWTLAGLWAPPIDFVVGGDMQFRTMFGEKVTFPLNVARQLLSEHRRHAPQEFYLGSMILRDVKILKFCHAGEEMLVVGSAAASEDNAHISSDILHLDCTQVPCDSVEVTGLLLHVMKQLETPSLDELVISAPYGSPPPADTPMFIEALLARYSGIKYLTLRHCSPQFLDIFMSKCELDISNALSLPKLKTLTFDNLAVRLPTVTAICELFSPNTTRSSSDGVTFELPRMLRLKKCTILIPAQDWELAHSMFEDFYHELGQALDIWFHDEDSTFKSIHGEDVGLSVQDVYDVITKRYY